MLLKARLEVNQQELDHLNDWLQAFTKQLEPEDDVKKTTAKTESDEEKDEEEEDKDDGDEKKDEMKAADIQEQLIKNHVSFLKTLFLVVSSLSLSLRNFLFLSLFIAVS